MGRSAAAFWAVVIIVAACLMPISGVADETATAHFDAVLKELGCGEALAGGLLTMSCDEATIIGQAPELQERGVLNPDLTQTAINLDRIGIAGAVTFTATTVALKDVYAQNASLDRLKVRAILIVPDLYGHLDPRPIFTFGFDRALYNRIDWSHFDQTNLAQISKGFAFSPWYQEELTRE